MLFMLVFIAPALPLNTGTHAYDFDQSSQLKTFHPPGILLALFSQPFSENEEGREDDKSVSHFVDAHSHLPAAHAEYLVNVGLTEVHCPSLCFNMHPSLFRLYHTYLI